jgi:hypothetical protein
LVTSSLWRKIKYSQRAVHTAHALAGRAGLQDDRPSAWAGLGRVGTGCGIPPTSLQGYHAATRGQSHTRPLPVASRAAPGSPRGRAPPGRQDATQLPACKIIRSGPARIKPHDLQRASWPVLILSASHHRAN